MGTKNNPGEYDCYENAEPNEPMFVLLARDRQAPTLVRRWATIRAQIGNLYGNDHGKVAEALACADAMEAWHKENR